MRPVRPRPICTSSAIEDLRRLQISPHAEAEGGTMMPARPAPARR
jgi:hypothetical protein